LAILGTPALDYPKYFTKASIVGALLSVRCLRAAAWARILAAA
jgi:hypothetical protein